MTQVQKIDCKSTTLVEFDEFEAKLQAFKGQYIDVVYNLDDEDQEKQARSDKYTIGKVISSLDSTHKELKAPLKERTDLIDGERKRIKDGLLVVQNSIKKQIEAHDQKIAEHAEMLQTKVDDIYALGAFEEGATPDARTIKIRLGLLKKTSIDDCFEHRKADATLAEQDTLKKLAKLLANRMQYEAEQAELERLRAEIATREQKDREEQIRHNAEIEARADSERERVKAIQDKDKAEKATKDAIEAGKRQKEAAEQRAKEQVKKAAQDERNRIEQKRLAEVKAAKEREANKTHHAKINNEALEGIVHLGVPRNHAIKVVTGIAKKKIPNITIAY